MVTTKRGTNQFHGSAYDFNQNSAIRFQRLLQQLRRRIGKPKSNYNRFGGSIGGPIRMLNVLGGGWYFFTNYEGERYPRSGPYVATVPVRHAARRHHPGARRERQYRSVQPGDFDRIAERRAASMCDPRGIGHQPGCEPDLEQVRAACNTWPFRVTMRPEHLRLFWNPCVSAVHQLRRRSPRPRFRLQVAASLPATGTSVRDNPTTNQVDIGGRHRRRQTGQAGRERSTAILTHAILWQASPALSPDPHQ